MMSYFIFCSFFAFRQREEFRSEQICQISARRGDVLYSLDIFSLTAQGFVFLFPPACPPLFPYFNKEPRSKTAVFNFGRVCLISLAANRSRDSKGDRALIPNPNVYTVPRERLFIVE